MAYEIRRLENEKIKCPKCKGRTVKFGHQKYNGKARRRCEDCGYQFTPECYKQV